MGPGKLKLNSSLFKIDSSKEISWPFHTTFYSISANAIIILLIDGVKFYSNLPAINKLHTANGTLSELYNVSIPLMNMYLSNISAALNKVSYFQSLFSCKSNKISIAYPLNYLYESWASLK